MRFLDELEAGGETFYRALAAHWPGQAAAFERCAAICAKNRVQILRAYQETVTDALETGYAFEGLDLSRYGPAPAREPADLAEAIAAGIAREESAAACHEDVAARSARLLATIPRVLQRAAEGHRRNAAFLRALMGA
jgi:hypothetical protein